MMTDRDYAVIAEALRKARQRTINKGCIQGRLAVGEAIAEVAAALVRDNPLFNAKRFIEAVIPE